MADVNTFFSVFKLLTVRVERFDKTKEKCILQTLMKTMILNIVRVFTFRQHLASKH